MLVFNQESYERKIFTYIFDHNLNSINKYNSHNLRDLRMVHHFKKN